jgi:hypothetical protein
MRTPFPKARSSRSPQTFVSTCQNIGDPEGFKAAAAGYFQGHTGGLGAGIEGKAALLDAQNYSQQRYDSLLNQKAATDIGGAKTALQTGIDSDQKDLERLASGGLAGGDEFNKTLGHQSDLYNSLTSNPAFGANHDNITVTRKSQALSVTAATIQGSMATAFQHGGINAAAAVIPSIDDYPGAGGAYPGASDADKVILKAGATAYLQTLQASNATAITANTAAFDAWDKAGEKGAPPPLDTLLKLHADAVNLGNQAVIAKTAVAVATGNYAAATSALSPSQHDAQNGVGQPGSIVGAPLTGATMTGKPPTLTADLSGLSTYANKGQPIQPQGFIVHHTGGGGTPQDVIQTLNQRGPPGGLGVQYIMDRDGKIYSALPEGTRGSHMAGDNGVAKNGSGLSNANTLGMEIIAKDAGDVTPQQKVAAASFIAAKTAQYGFPVSKVFGHGEVQSNKEPDEGLAVAQMVRGGAAGAATRPSNHRRLRRFVRQQLQPASTRISWKAFIGAKAAPGTSATMARHSVRFSCTWAAWRPAPMPFPVWEMILSGRPG